MQRWLKFVKYLPEMGWQPTVITTQDGDYPALDESPQNDIPPSVEVIRTETPTFRFLFGKNKTGQIPYGSLQSQKDDSAKKKILIWLRLNFIVPDARVIWNKRAYKAAHRILQKNDHRIVITSGPPHSTHLIGMKLKKKFPVKWIADFRDPWTTIDYLKKMKRSFFIEWIDRFLEQKAVHNSDLIISINRQILHDLKAESKGFIIPNGFDPEDFATDIEQSIDKFIIGYFGNITPDRNPAKLVRAIIAKKDNFRELELHFWGNIDSNVKDEISGLDRERIIKFQPYLSHQKSVQAMQSSNILLLIINDVPDNLGIITGKIFEYIGAGRPILGLGPVEGEAAEILKETKAGEMFSIENLAGQINFIKENYLKWKEGKQTSVKSDSAAYDRRILTEILSEKLKEILEKPPITR